MGGGFFGDGVAGFVYDQGVEIDDYIAEQPEPVAERLRDLVTVIRDQAPMAQERISWGMPTFKINGKNAVHVAAHAAHIGLYPGPEAIVEFSAELGEFKTSKGAIQLPLEGSLPLDLVRRIVAYQVLRLTGETRRTNTDTIARQTGISWQEWVSRLDAEGARDLDHAAIARWVAKQGVSDWWAQSVTIAYEQHIGRRIPGQSSDGSFKLAVSKTLPGDMTEVLRRWVAFVEPMSEFDGMKVTRPGVISETPTWRYWRCGLADGSVISVNIQTKPTGEKSTLAINHDKLTSEDDRTRWRTYWKDVLAQLT